MAKYVAVGVLAVILLATVTYESPEPEQVKVEDSRQVTGSFATKPLEAAPTPAVSPTGAMETPAEAPAETEAPTPEGSTEQAVDTTTTLPVSAVRELAYVVKAGQTLSDVAGELLGSRGRWRELYEANKDKLPDPDHVVAGMTLTFPSEKATASPKRAVATTTTASSPRSSSQGSRTYTVAKGDTLYSIARAQLGAGGRWREIAQLNGIDGAGLRAGDELRLPK
jgi:nucleoid-associated protein YgaU